MGVLDRRRAVGPKSRGASWSAQRKRVTSSTLRPNGTIAPDPVLFELIDHWTVSPKCYPVVAGFARITELKYVVGRAFREERVEEHLADYVYFAARIL